MKAKTLEYYMGLSYPMEIVEDSTEGGYVVAYPDLPGCITCGETVELAIENAKDAKKAWLSVAIEEGLDINEPESLEAYSGQFRLRMPRSLHKSLSDHARREGVSMNQYCVYLLTKNNTLNIK